MEAKRVKFVVRLHQKDYEAATITCDKYDVLSLDDGLILLSMQQIDKDLHITKTEVFAQVRHFTADTIDASPTN